MLEVTPLRSSKPMAQQIRDAVVALIDRDNLKTGDQLPTEAQLCAAFGISRPSLREALRLLEQEGLIVTQHGRGRFLSAAAALKVARPITTFESITAMLGALGYHPATQVLSAISGPAAADPDAAKALALTPTAEVVTVERLRRDDTAALVYSLSVIPRALLGDDITASSLERSLNEILAAVGHRPAMSSANVSATLLPAEVAGRIGAAATQPWLLVTETCLSDAGTPVLYARDYHRGDLISFNFSRR